MKGGVSWPEMSWLGAEGTLRGQGSWCSPLRSLAHDTQAGPRAPCPPTPTDPSAKMPACAPHPAIHHCSPIPCHFLWTSQLPALCWMGWWGSEPSSESGVLARPLASHPPSIGASCHARLTGLLPIRPHSPTPLHEGLEQGSRPRGLLGTRGETATYSSHESWLGEQAVPGSPHPGQPSLGSRQQWPGLPDTPGTNLPRTAPRDQGWLLVTSEPFLA